MLDLRDLSLEGVEPLCQADMTWKLVPLYYCPGKFEGPFLPDAAMRGIQNPSFRTAHCLW